MKIICDNETVKKIYPRDFSENGFELTATLEPTYVQEPSQYTEEINDLTFDVDDEGIIDYNYQLTVTPSVGVDIKELSYNSSDNLIGTIDSNGLVEWVSDGKIDVTANINRFFKKGLSLNLKQTHIKNYTFLSYSEGSLGKHMTDEIDRLILNKTWAATRTIFTSRNKDTNVFIRNPNCFMKDVIGVTATSAYCSCYDTGAWWYRNVTMISPIHYIAARHWGPVVGNTVRFVSKNNVVYTRTVVGIKYSTYPNGMYSDLAIGVLDEALPTDIEFCKVLPEDFQDYLIGYETPPTDNDVYIKQIPIVAIPQDWWWIIHAWRYYMYNNSNGVVIGQPTNSTYASWYQELRGGDSGLPNGCIINNEWVLFGCAYTIPGRPFTSLNIDWINDAMDYLSATYSKPTYHLTEYDLSSFPKYK